MGIRARGAGILARSGAGARAQRRHPALPASAWWRNGGAGMEIR